MFLINKKLFYSKLNDLVVSYNVDEKKEEAYCKILYY